MAGKRSEKFSMSAQTIDAVSEICVQTLLEAGRIRRILSVSVCP